MLLAHTLKIKKSKSIQRIYDLKGSWMKREVSLSERSSRTKTLKDVNFLKLKRKEPLTLAENDRYFIIRTLQCDSEFLRSQNIMDYSLLLAIEKVKMKSDLVNVTQESFESVTLRRKRVKSISSYRDKVENRYAVNSEDGKHKYHIAVIDYLQEWNGSKKLERLLKITFKHADPQGLSAIEPEPYQKRFMRFMRNVVFEYK